jgi:hypothetical protein
MCCCTVVNFLCYCIVCIDRGCDKFHIQQSLTDVGSMVCVYVNVNVNHNVRQRTFKMLGQCTCTSNMIRVGLMDKI